METILAGDIGGTNARLAVFPASAPRDGVWVPLVERIYPSRDFASLSDVIRVFLAVTNHRPETASLGVAGPVRRGRADMMNLTWSIEAAALARDFGFRDVRLLNDLEAAAWGIDTLGPSGRETLFEGEEEEDGNRCLVSAGTGLGEAGMVRVRGGFLPFRSEGGHVNFAPRDALESELLAWLMARHGHVSYERVVSGPGLLNVYAFLRDTGRGSEPPWLKERMEADPSGRVITECALEGESELCDAAVDLFVSAYGSAAGNMALKVLATAGVWLGGGIAPRILPRLRTPAFREAFLAKGRLRDVMERIPVRVVTDDTGLALAGAARAALAGTPSLA